METLSVEIRNSKVKRILKELEALNLIKIKPKLTLNTLLIKLRKNADTAPSLDEITAEVEQVRKMRYEKGS
ncbi:MAG TPA: hypothetical protein DER09_00285 [Prolixibacteraceae bacterium]|jgi:hypothetical protein|nr:hypothetical protein [Prolixibacteraceae bacterium]